MTKVRNLPRKTGETSGRPSRGAGTRPASRANPNQSLALLDRLRRVRRARAARLSIDPNRATAPAAPPRRRFVKSRPGRAPPARQPVQGAADGAACRARAWAPRRARSARDVTSGAEAGICGRRVPGSGLNGKTCISQPPRSQRRVFSNIASLSVGKPAMRSAPKACGARLAHPRDQVDDPPACRAHRFRIIRRPPAATGAGEASAAPRREAVHRWGRPAASIEDASAAHSGNSFRSRNSAPGRRPGGRRPSADMTPVSTTSRKPGRPAGAPDDQ